MDYIKDKLRIRLQDDNGGFHNYIIDAATSGSDVIKVGDVVKEKGKRLTVEGFYRTDGTYKGSRLKPVHFDSFERNGKTFEIRVKSNKSNKMKNGMMGNMLDKFKSLYMPEVAENLRISLNGQVCVPVDGEYVSIDANGELVSFPENFTIDMPVYVISRQIDQINVGDIVARGNSYSKVIEIVKNPDGSVKDLKTTAYSGFNHTVKPVKDFMLGQKTIKVVINLFNGFNGNEINPLMLAMLNEDGGDNDFMMMLIAMQAMNPNGTNGVLAGMNNPMMLMALCGDGGGNMFQNMMMLQMMQNMGGNSNANNPFANFGTMFQPKQNENKQTLND